jgi:YD repeat-containing protein
MGRLGGMTEITGTNPGGTQMAAATYGVAGELLTLNYFLFNETRQYNSLFQLTHHTVTDWTNATLMDMTYSYVNGSNNGQIASATDGVVGETVNYTYDPLNRLKKAETAGSGGWGQSFTYDGFGNMTAKTRTKGTAGVVPELTATINPATNGGPSSYAPGLPDGSDVENRPLGATMADGTSYQYAYDQAGKRVLMHQTGPYWFSGTWDFGVYDISGRRLTSVNCHYEGAIDHSHVYPVCGTTGNNVYFGGKMVVSHGKTVAVDRLGSVRANQEGERFAYYPYGEERGVSGGCRRRRMVGRSSGRTCGMRRGRTMRISGIMRWGRGGLMWRIRVE